MIEKVKVESERAENGAKIAAGWLDGARYNREGLPNQESRLVIDETEIDEEK